MKRACRVRVSAKRARLTRCTSQTLLPSLVLLNISSRIGENSIFLLTQKIAGCRVPPRFVFFFNIKFTHRVGWYIFAHSKNTGSQGTAPSLVLLNIGSRIGEDGIFLLTQNVLGRRALPRPWFFLTLVHESGGMAYFYSLKTYWVAGCCPVLGSS